MALVVALLSALALPASAAIWMEPGELPAAVTGRTYAAGPVTVVGGARCPRNNPVLQVVGGELPEGLALTAAGYFAGTPTQPGIYSFIVRAANDCEAVQQEYRLEVTGAPVLTVEPRSIDVSYPQGSAPTQDPLVVQVRSSWGGLAYTVDSGDEEWLRATPVRGVTPVAGSPLNSDGLELHVDPSRLPPGTYRVVMRLSSFRGANAPVVPVTLRVLPPVGDLPQLGPEPTAVPAPAPRGATILPTPSRAPTPTRAAPANRLSRVAPPRRRFAASTPKPVVPPVAAGHDKPSPVGKPVEPPKPAEQAKAEPPKQPGHAAPPPAAKPSEPVKPAEHAKSAEPAKPAPTAHKIEAPKHEKH